MKTKNLFLNIFLKNKKFNQSNTEKKNSKMQFNQSLIYFGVLLLLSSTSAFQDWSADISAKKWNDYAFNKLTEQLNKKIKTNIAKNVILFLGDGLFDRLF